MYEIFVNRLAQVFEAVAEEDVMVVVHAGGVAIYSICHVKMVGLAASASECRADGHSVDARTAVSVLIFLSVHFDLCEIVAAGLLDRMEGDHIFELHLEPRNLIYFYFSYIETALLPFVLLCAECLRDASADCIVLDFKRGIDPASIRIEGHRAEMAVYAGNRADDVALEVGLEECAGERAVHAVLLLVQCDALDMELSALYTDYFGILFRSLAGCKDYCSKQKYYFFHYLWVWLCGFLQQR